MHGSASAPKVSHVANLRFAVWARCFVPESSRLRLAALRNRALLSPLEGVDATRPGAGAAVAAGGVALPDVVFVDAGEAGRPDAELCPAGPAPPGPDPTGHGALFCPAARVVETRNNHNHMIFVFSFM
jgi:hypothetical protein